MKLSRHLAAIGAALCLFASHSPADENAVNPQIAKIANEVSEDRIKAIIEKLVSFGTRNTLSDADRSGARRGRRAPVDLRQFQSYSPRLQVRFDKYGVKKQGQRIFKDVDLYNVIAVLPGKTMPETQVWITGHYDSLNLGTPRTRARGRHGRRRHRQRTQPDPADDPGGVRKERRLARPGRLRRWQRHRRRDGTGARDEPVRVRQDPGVCGLRRRGAGPHRQQLAGRQGARRKTR